MRVRRRIAIAIALGIVAVMVTAVAIPVASTLQPDYYRRYPVLSDRMAHWSTSTHSRISCGACHVNPGIRGAVSFAIAAVPAYYSQLLQGPDESNLLSAPDREACQKCHTSYRSVAPSGDLLIPHRAHVEVLDLECSQCHQDLVHSLNERGFNRPEMEVCLAECHDGDSATDECVKCHTLKSRPETHDRPDWLQVHGTLVESEDCAACHDWTPAYCAECHEERPASHVGNWKSGHAETARLRGDGCTVCHGGEEFCLQCH